MGVRGACHRTLGIAAMTTLRLVARALMASAAFTLSACSTVGGLAGTVPEYLRFAQLLVNGGTLDGKAVVGNLRPVKAASGGVDLAATMAAVPELAAAGHGGRTRPRRRRRS